MTTLKRTLAGSNLTLKLFLLSLLLFIGFSCEKEKDPDLTFDLQVTKIACYPENNISITFNIDPKGNYSPFEVKWYKPSDFQGTGPFTVTTKNNLDLDFEIKDSKNNSSRYTYTIRTDTIDSLKYDYRHQYTGNYSCDGTYTYNGNEEYFHDTLTVLKTDDFKVITISNSHMIYNGADNFFGYHSFARFVNDSIYYSVSGPLGNYYTNYYRGIRIKE